MSHVATGRAAEQSKSWDGERRKRGHGLEEYQGNQGVRPAPRRLTSGALDVKVARLSDTHTAHKFVIPVAER